MKIIDKLVSCKKVGVETVLWLLINDFFKSYLPAEVGAEEN